MNKMRVAFKKITKTKWLVACISFVCVLQMISCNEDPTLQAAYFAIIDDGSGSNAKELLVTPDGGVKTLTLISNREWEILYDQVPWLNISPTAGNGIASISFTVSPNESIEEDSVYISVINNTLLVVDSFKVKRENYLKTYKGNSFITSPITSISTNNDTTGITASSVIRVENGKTILNFKLPLQLSTGYSMDLTFEGNIQKVTENEKVKFVYQGTGTFDFTSLGAIINDPSVTGIKNTSIEAELAAGVLSFEAVIDSNTNGSIKPDVSTIISFKGNK